MLSRFFEDQMCFANQIGHQPMQWDEDGKYLGPEWRAAPQEVMREFPHSITDAWMHGTGEEAEYASFLAAMTVGSNTGDAISDVLQNYFRSGNILKAIQQTERFLEEQMDLAKVGKALPQAEIRKTVRTNLNVIQTEMDELMERAFDEFKRASRISQGRIQNMNDAVSGKRRISLPRFGKSKPFTTDAFRFLKFIESKNISRGLLVLDWIPRVVKIVESEHQLQQTILETTKFTGQAVGTIAGARVSGALCRAIPPRNVWLIVGKGVCVIAGFGLTYVLGQSGEGLAEDFSKPILENYL